MSLKRWLSIATLLSEVIELLRDRSLQLSLDVVTPEAVIHARKRLGPEPLRELFERRAERIQPHPSFHSLRVWIPDGVDFRLPATPQNDEEFGRPTASAFPMMQIVALLDAESRQVRALEMGPYNESERARFAALMDNLGPQDLVVGDQGFAGGPQFEACLDRKIHFLIRGPVGWKPIVVCRLSDGSYIVLVTYRRPLPACLQTRRRRNELVTLTLRMIEYRIGSNQRVRLFTDLLDHQEFPAQEFAHFYHNRWQVEIAFDEIKTHLATVLHGTLDTPFRSKTPEGVYQEAYALIIVYNIVRELMLRAGQLHNVPPRDISFVGALEAIRRAIPNFQHAGPALRTALLRLLLTDIASKRNRRPRRPRICPRAVKRKENPYPVKRKHHKEIVNTATTDLRLVRRYNRLRH